MSCWSPLNDGLPTVKAEFNSWAMNGLYDGGVSDELNAPTKRALVMCYTPVGSDARVSNQIRWLESAGYRVDILSRGPKHAAATGKQFRIGYPPLALRLAMYVFLPLRARFYWLVEKHLPLAQLTGERYDSVIVNDLHLLPWAVNTCSDLSEGPVILDLHEVYEGNGTGLFYKLLLARYFSWLLSFISSPVFTKYLTVADGIADLYHKQYGIPRPGVIHNVAPYEELEPSAVNPSRIALVHHGAASSERGIDLLLDSALELDTRFALVLMLLGDASELARLRRHPAVAAGRAEFRPAVPVTEVARSLNDYDLEVIFFPPRFANNAYALPNKFFEAIQGRLGVVIGESPEMVGFVRDKGLGIVVDGWSGSDLAAALNRLSVEEITAMKQAAHRAAAILSTRGEGSRFLAEIGA